MIASLPMYDRAETAGAHDRLWNLIRDALRHHGVSAPDTLSRGTDLWEDWQRPDLLLSQTCGLPYRARLKDKVRLVASPVWDLDGAPGTYHSVIVARLSYEDLPDPFTLAVNDSLSQSGWAAALDWLQDRPKAFKVLVTGAHAASAKAVSEGRADLAALDAVTATLIERYDEMPGLQRIGISRATPALPYITSRLNDPASLFSALAASIAALTPSDRETLCLTGVTPASQVAYLAEPIPPNLAAFPSA